MFEELIRTRLTEDRGFTGARREFMLMLSREFVQKYLRCFRFNDSSDSLLVFLGIMSHMDHNGWAYPSHATLGEYVGIKQEATVTRLVAILNGLVLPLPGGPQKLINIWSGRNAAGHLRYYYHLWPAAGNEDLAPEPYITKTQVLPGSVHTHRVRCKTKVHATQAPDEGAFLIKPPLVEPRVGKLAANPPLVEPGVAEPPVAQPGVKVNPLNPINPLPAAVCESRTGVPRMPLSKLYLDVEFNANTRLEAEQTFICTHCQAVITQGHRKCPGCDTEIVWKNNRFLAKRERRIARRQVAKPAPNYSPAAKWLLAFALEHPDPLAKGLPSRVFFRADHHEAEQVTRYTAKYGQQRLEELATWASERDTGGRGLIVKVLNAMTARPGGPSRGKPGPGGKPKGPTTKAELQAIWDAQPP